MPDQGDHGVPEERFAAAVELGRPPARLPTTADLARDLEIVAMLRALGPGFSPRPDAKARMRARVMGALAVDGPPSDGGGIAVGRPDERAGRRTHRGAARSSPPHRPRASADAAARRARGRRSAPGSRPRTAVLAEPT